MDVDLIALSFGLFFFFFSLHFTFLNHCDLFLFSGADYEGITTGCGSVGESSSLS